MNKETIFFYFYMKLNTMKISIGNDHAGPDYKDAIVAVLQAAGYEIKNHGTNTTDSVDYPDFIHPVAKEVSTGETALGIIICGSGNGAAMTANKYKKIRAALCWNKELVVLRDSTITPIF